MRRTQIYLDDQQERLIVERAAILRRTKSQIIRQAIDSYLAQPLDEEAELAEFRAAVTAALGAEPHLTHEMLGELREAGRARADELEERWHGRRSRAG
jgi:predicted transcriptional regulator